MPSLSSQNLETQAASFGEAFQTLKHEIGKVIIGQEETVDLLLISLFSRGHCLLVGVPGLAKTLLIKSLSEALALTFNRIQFTPDLMPSDITGTDIIEERADGTKGFKFIRGPVFANIVLADEINRTPPKTQSALLEAMQEYKVTAAGTTYALDKPFFVLATQNPIEQEGTYPLPEAQLDRFMFNVWLDYPSYNEELEIIRRTTRNENVIIKPVVSGEDILHFQNLVRDVAVPDAVLEYAVRMVNATRPGTTFATEVTKKYISWGAGPRASQYLIVGAKTRALAQGRFSIAAEDVRALARPVLRHRVVTNYTAESEGLRPESVVDLLVNSIPAIR
jgi:MoxR-like ATPase